jgi:glycosyltransferase involved in cell wall biosynthesis
MSATVIIPTTGSPEFTKAVESVLTQTYPTKCYLVIDGQEYFYGVKNFITHMKNKGVDTKNLNVCTLPDNVGKNGFYGHRVYAAFTHLIDSDYVLYLDQDNWFEPNHVESCIKTIEDNNLDWCNSLRNVCDKKGEFICQDNCESLGKWQTYHGMNHVDTNTYCIKTEIAIKLASAWHGGWGQDRVFLHTISQYFKKWDCTRQYTVNYRVDGGKGSVNADFFINGNAVMNGKYNGEFPWNKQETMTSLSASSQDTNTMIKLNHG